ncbi:MAG: hypothetical protein J3R72DRAFT_259105 [Linnemannia gamsii]|nr:MAG: hypothetical protein J3R72DRAFT_259105 [Linnemannia gamsii]
MCAFTHSCSMYAPPSSACNLSIFPNHQPLRPFLYQQVLDINHTGSCRVLCTSFLLFFLLCLSSIATHMLHPALSPCIFSFFCFSRSCFYLSLEYLCPCVCVFFCLFFSC